MERILIPNSIENLTKISQMIEKHQSLTGKGKYLVFIILHIGK